MKPIRHRYVTINCSCLAMWACVATSIRADDQQPARIMTWLLRDEFWTKAACETPNPDLPGQPVWNFLRTTRSEGPVESRQWLRDGRYVPLADQDEKLFGSPLNGWAYRARESLAPAVGKLAAEYDSGLKFAPGDTLIAPGPDHAIVIGWRSPVGGKRTVRDVVEQGGEGDSGRDERPSAGSERDQWVKLGFQMVFARQRTDPELAKSVAFLEGQEQRYAVEQRVSVPDLHATIPNQLGIDHTRLTFTHSGRTERRTDPDVTRARVVEELLV